MGKIAKLTFVIALIFGSMVISHAAEFKLVNNQFQHVYTNTFTFNLTTNQTQLQTNLQGTVESVYHTFHIFYNISGTNGGTTMAVYRTVDGANFYNFTNYTISTATTNFEIQAVGKWGAFEFISSDLCTNGSAVVSYISQ